MSHLAQPYRALARQSQLPVRASDSRCGYRSGSLPALAFSLALVAALSCFTGICEASGLWGTDPALAASAPP